MKFKLAFITLITMTFINSCTQKEVKEKITLDVSLIDTTFNPTADFYHFANNGWLQKYPLPDDESRYGSFDQLAKETSMKVQTLLEKLASEDHEQGTIEQKVGDFYAMGMDMETIEKQGLEPLKPEFEKIKSIKTIEDVQDQLAHFHSYGISSLFGFFGSTDIKNSEMNIAHLSQGGLGMSDRDYYLNDDDRTVEIREAYKKHLVKMMILTGISEVEAEEMAETIMKIETRLAKASFTRLENRNPHATYNKMTQKEVSDNYPSFDWKKYMTSLGVHYTGEINVRQPKFFEEMNSILTEISVEEWKDYFYWNLIDATAGYLTQELQEQNFDFFGRTMQGSPKMKPRWRRVLGTTNAALGDAIGQKFSEKYFPAEAKERMVTLVNNLKTAYAQRIDKLEWMSNETKAQAKDKLASMNVKIGYPDEWKDFSDLQVGREAYVLNVLAANKFGKEYNLNKIGKPVNKEEWFSLLIR